MARVCSTTPSATTGPRSSPASPPPNQPGCCGRSSPCGAGRALATIGRGGLVSFVACVLLSVLGDAAQTGMDGSIPGRLAVDLWTIPALWVVAEALARAETARRGSSTRHGSMVTLRRPATAG